MSYEATPRLAELMSRYLERQAESPHLGLTPTDAEITPYEAGPVQPIDARRAWEAGQSALSFYGTANAPSGALPHWSSLVVGQEPIVALAFCVGNFPQMVRHFHRLLAGTSESLRPVPGTPIDVPQLLERADRLMQAPRFPEAILVLAGLRLAKQYPSAERFAQTLDAQIPPAWKLGWDNERAALAWHSGRPDEAQRIWLTLDPIVPVLFNRGVAALVLGQPRDARQPLDQVIAQLPDSSPWQHLAQVYRTLADG